jgi:hypothetical protein
LSAVFLVDLSAIFLVDLSAVLVADHISPGCVGRM